MKNFITTLILISLCACSTSNKEVEAMVIDPNSSEFSYLDKFVEGKRIVALGESSNGHGSLTSYKTKIVQYLHEKHGYDVVLLQVGSGDAGILWNNVDKISGRELRNATLYGSVPSEEILPLFTYIKDKSMSADSLIYGGYDAQHIGKSFDFKLNDIIARLEPKVIQDSIKNGLINYYNLFTYKDDEAKWTDAKTRYLNAIQLSESIINDNEADILSSGRTNGADLNIIKRTLQDLRSLVNYQIDETYTRRLAIRDSLMAANVVYHLETLYPTKKAIIWGHNGHIEKTGAAGDNIKWMGHSLHEKYGKDYCTIGMFVTKGAYYQTWSKKTSPFDINDPTFVEGFVTKNYGKNVFLRLPEYENNISDWPHREIKAFEPEAGGEVLFVPSKRLDAIIILENSNPITLVQNQTNDSGPRVER